MNERNAAMTALKLALALFALSALLTPARLAALEEPLPPAGVLRASLISSYSYTSGSYDGNWSRGESPGDANALAGQRADILRLNTGVSLEMGILEWLGAYVLWYPGWTYWSDFAAIEGTSQPLSGLVGFEQADINGVSDLALGAAFLIVGTGGAVTSDRLRLAAGPRFVIPMPEPGYDDQSQAISSGDPWTIDTARRAFGLGAAVELRMDAASFLAWSLEGEATYYFETERTSYLDPRSTARVQYGLVPSVELAAHLSLPVDPGVALELSLPVRLDMSPAVRIDGDLQEDTDSLALTIVPALTLELDRPAVPLELMLSYGFPIAGRNVLRRYSLELQVTSDFRLY